MPTKPNSQVVLRAKQQVAAHKLDNCLKTLDSQISRSSTAAAQQTLQKAQQLLTEHETATYDFMPHAPEEEHDQMISTITNYWSTLEEFENILAAQTDSTEATNTTMQQATTLQQTSSGMFTLDNDADCNMLTSNTNHNDNRKTLGWQYLNVTLQKIQRTTREQPDKNNLNDQCHQNSQYQLRQNANQPISSNASSTGRHLEDTHYPQPRETALETTTQTQPMISITEDDP